jgi:hypothetical protein
MRAGAPEKAVKNLRVLIAVSDMCTPHSNIFGGAWIGEFRFE